MAALLLCTAVGGFLASEILLLKQIGVGIGLTIVIDATFVRCILVPAAMGVLGGDLNWWAPKPIKDLVEFVGLREEE
jgi:RND superfamily putative drug exporter